MISVEIKTWTIDFEESHHWCGWVSAHDVATVNRLPVKHSIRLIGWCVDVLCDLRVEHGGRNRKIGTANAQSFRFVQISVLPLYFVSSSVTRMYQV